MASGKTRRRIWVAVLAPAAFLAIFPLVAASLQESALPPAGPGANALEQIGRAISAYRETSNGYYPPSLWSLYPDFVANPRLLADGTPASSRFDRAEEFFYRYHYVFDGRLVRNAMPADQGVVFYPVPDKDGLDFHCYVLDTNEYVTWKDSAYLYEHWRGTPKE